MPDFAPNYTFRYKLRYGVQGNVHTMQFRFARTNGPTEVPSIRTVVQDFLDTFAANRWNDWNVLSASYAIADSDIFLPDVTPPSSPGTVATASRVTSHQAIAISFVGRSGSGLRCALYCYGLALDPVASSGALDFRLYGTENANIDAAVAALNGGIPNIVANDNVTAFFYPYVNLKYNDYWVRQTRG